MNDLSFTKSQKTATKVLYIIGMIVCFAGIIISYSLNDYYTALVTGIVGIVATGVFIPCFKLQKYTIFLYVISALLSLLLFPSIMIVTDYPQQAIIYQLITPSVWSLAMSNKKDLNYWPIIIGGLLASVDVYKMSQIVILSEALQYGIIFYLIYIFIYIISFIYIKNARQAYLKMKEQVKIDYLTTAFNKSGILDRINSYIETNTPFYLVFFDIDNFKIINDTAGHTAGDTLLINLTKLWWKHLYNVKGCIGRIGGDEFAMLIESDNQEYVASVVDRAIKIGSLSDNDLLKNITLSAGITSYPNDSVSVENLFMYADTAMYKAKSSGKNTYQFFDKKLYNQILSNYETKNKIIKAIKYDLFDIVYQPQIDLKSKTIYGYEALLRLSDTFHVSTQYIIDIAEKYGLIYDLDNYVLKKVLKESKSLLNKNPNLIISINISGKHLSLPNATSEIIDIINSYNFNPKNICLEITESAFINSLNIAKVNINKLSEYGIKLALDDFGMGYSSLSYLSELNVDHIKIEKFFINNIFSQQKSSNIPNIIINIGHLFNYKIIAEGVESIDQKEYLDNQNCDIIQGYFYSKPLSLQDALKYQEKTVLIN